jgi:hypothetical protein
VDKITKEILIVIFQTKNASTAPKTLQNRLFYGLGAID